MARCTIEHSFLCDEFRFRLTGNSFLRILIRPEYCYLFLIDDTSFLPIHTHLILIEKELSTYPHLSSSPYISPLFVVWSPEKIPIWADRNTHLKKVELIAMEITAQRAALRLLSTDQPHIMNCGRFSFSHNARQFHGSGWDMHGIYCAQRRKTDIRLGIRGQRGGTQNSNLSLYLDAIPKSKLSSKQTKAA